jgi:GNAT superfamily N-acetyltransferase
MVNFGRIALQFWQKSAQLRRNFSTNERSELVFRTYSMSDYHEIQTALIDLCRRCENTNQVSVMGSVDSQSLVLFHCEFADYLRCMEQYSESYYHTLVESTNNRVVAAFLTNFKRLHFSSYVMTGGFARLIRVDPSQRRKNVGIHVMQAAVEQVRRRGMDYCLGYTLASSCRWYTMHTLPY